MSKTKRSPWVKEENESRRFTGSVTESKGPRVIGDFTDRVADALMILSQRIES